MTEAEIYQGLTELMRRQFKNEQLVLTPELTAEGVSGWDSLAHIRLILSIEKQFGVKFRTSEVAAFKNVGELAQMIAKKLQ